MVRRAGARSGGRVLPGLSGALLERFAGLDKAFHRTGACRWCDACAGLRAGRPVVVDPDGLHPYLRHEEFACSREWAHDDRGAFLVTGDRWERLQDD